MLLFFVKLNLQLKILWLFYVYSLVWFSYLVWLLFEKPDVRSFELPAYAQAIFCDLIS